MMHSFSLTRLFCQLLDDGAYAFGHKPHEQKKGSLFYSGRGPAKGQKPQPGNKQQAAAAKSKRQKKL